MDKYNALPREFQEIVDDLIVTLAKYSQDKNAKAIEAKVQPQLRKADSEMKLPDISSGKWIERGSFAVKYVKAEMVDKIRAVAPTLNLRRLKKASYEAVRQVLASYGEGSHWFEKNTTIAEMKEDIVAWFSYLPETVLEVEYLWAGPPAATDN